MKAVPPSSTNGIGRCAECPSSTPLRPDPERLQRAQSMQFDPPLDEGIREVVMRLVAGGVETFESCEGGPGHAFPEPTVRFHGQREEGFRALAAALQRGCQVGCLRRIWPVVDGEPTGPYWELTFVKEQRG